MSDVGPAVRTMQVPGAERKQEISPEQVASSVTAVAEQVRKQYRVATDEKKASKYQNEITTKYWREVSARISANYMFSQVIICLLVGGGLSAASQEEEQAVTNLTAFFCSAFFS